MSFFKTLQLRKLDALFLPFFCSYFHFALRSAFTQDDISSIKNLTVTFKIYGVTKHGIQQLHLVSFTKLYNILQQLKENFACKYSAQMCNTYKHETTETAPQN